MSPCFYVVQVGSVTNTFNVPGVEENCFFLKDMEGAKALRQRINECFEISALPSTTPEERKRLLTFVVVCHQRAQLTHAHNYTQLGWQHLTQLYASRMAISL